MSKYGVFSGPDFPVFGLNTEIYGATCTKALELIQVIQSRNGGPYALRTKLG